MSDAAVRLIPIQCPRCQMPVPAQVDEVAWVCGQCNQGMLLSEALGVRPLDVFFSEAIPAGGQGKPFWVSRGSVTPVARKAYKGNQVAEMNQFWSMARLFFVPAFKLPIQEVISLGARFIHQPAEMKPGAVVKFLPVVVPPADVKAISEYIVMSVEAARKDALQELQFNIRLEPPQLWVLP